MDPWNRFFFFSSNKWNVGECLAELWSADKEGML